MVEVTFFARSSDSSIIELEEIESLRREYLREDIYQFHLVDPSLFALDLIEKARLTNLFLSVSLQAKIKEKTLYLLFPLLIALINKFFGVDISTFSIYSLAGNYLRLLPLDQEGKGVYATSAKIDYFLYYVRIEDLLGYQYISSSPLLEKTGSPSLFGVYFWDKKGRVNRLSTEVENLEEVGLYGCDLPKRELLREIASSFQLEVKRERCSYLCINKEECTDLCRKEAFRRVVLRKGLFWTELGKSWLEEAWRNVLEERLPLVTLYYVPEDVEAAFSPLRTKNLLTLANYLFGGSREAKANSLSFPARSLEEVKRVLEKLSQVKIEQWFSFVAPPGEELALQRAIEKKFPSATALNVEGTIVANIPSTSIFTPQEMEEAKKEVEEEGELPKEYLVKAPPLPSPLPPLQDVKGQAYVKVGEIDYPLGLKYEELKDIWSPAILSPWGKAQLEEGKWSKYWFK